MIEKLVKFIYKPQMLIISLNFRHKLLNCFSVSKIKKKKWTDDFRTTIVHEPIIFHEPNEGPCKGLQGGFIRLMGCIYIFFFLKRRGCIY